MRALRDRRGSPDLPRSPSIRRAPCAGSTGEGGTERCPPPVGTRRGGGTAGRRAPGVQHSPPYTLHTPPSHPSAQHAALHARNPPRRDSLMADITVSTGGGGSAHLQAPPIPKPTAARTVLGGWGFIHPSAHERSARCRARLLRAPSISPTPPPHKYLQAAGCDAPSIWHGPPWHGQRARSAGRPGTVSLADWCHLPHAGLGMGDKGLPGPGGGGGTAVCQGEHSATAGLAAFTPPPPPHPPYPSVRPAGLSQRTLLGEDRSRAEMGTWLRGPPSEPPRGGGRGDSADHVHPQRSGGVDWGCGGGDVGRGALECVNGGVGVGLKGRV